MGYWHFIQPESTINYIRNPSFEENVTDGWVNYSTGAAGGNRFQSGGNSKFGAYGLGLEKNAGAQADRWGQGTTLTPTSVLNSDYIASTWVYIPGSAEFTLLLQKSVGVGAQQLSSVVQSGPTNGWVRIETPVLTANATGDNLVVTVWITGTPTIYTYVDAVQIEIKDHTTTYCDGDQEGCEWLAAEHNGHSQRSAISRAGGLLVDFADRNFDIEGMIGAGMSPIALNVDTYAILPGGELNSQKTNIRPFSLTGWVKGTSLEDLHATRQQLIEDVAPNSVPGDQPVTIRYTGAAVTKEIEAYYESGLEGRIRGDFPCLEQAFALRFLATDPDFYEIGESSDILDSNDFDLNLRIVSGRLRSTGQWDVLGPPNAAGTYTVIYAIEEGPDKTVYWGGDFQNFDNIGATADYLVQYTPSTATWAAVSGAAPNGVMRDIKMAPNDDLYVCGDFQNMGGVAAADFIAYWTGAAWGAVGVPNAGAAAITSIYAMAFASNGDLYVVGEFTNLANIAAADYIAMWDGAAWNAVGAPLAGAAAITRIRDVAIDSQDNVYVVGNFTTFANVTGADYIAMWDGANWNQVVQLNALGRTIEVDNQDTAIFGGDFQNAGGEASADFIAQWNGQAIQALGTGMNNAVRDVRIAPDGLVYAAGVFTTAGGLTVPGVAKWNGARWAHLDNVHAGGASPYTVGFSVEDPVIPTNYDVWEGFQFAVGNALYFAGIATVTNAGTEEAYPRIQISRSGGSSAILYSIRNETTGKELLFSYSLLDGERLTIDLAPTHKSITSSFFGERQEALLANSDFGEWALRPGDNDVSCFVDTVGGPTVHAEIIWPDPYWSAD